LLGSGERSLDKLIAKLDDDLDSLQNRKKELEKRLSHVESLEEKHRARETEIEEKEKKLSSEYVEKLEKQLRDGKREIDRLVKEIRESRASREKIKESRDKLDRRSKAARDLKKAITDKRTIDGRVLKMGDLVWIEKFKAEGEVVEMIGKKKAKIAVGSAFMTVDTIDLTRKEKSKSSPGVSGKRPISSVKADAVQGDFSPEIMLRGMTVDEALEALEKFLDDAVLAGVGQVYIVHGKGTGRLRKNLSNFLKSHRSVESIRIGDWNEGGHGVTIARLKT